MHLPQAQYPHWHNCAPTWQNPSHSVRWWHDFMDATTANENKAYKYMSYIICFIWTCNFDWLNAIARFSNTIFLFPLKMQLAMTARVTLDNAKTKRKKHTLKDWNYFNFCLLTVLPQIFHSSKTIMSLWFGHTWSYIVVKIREFYKTRFNSPIFTFFKFCQLIKDLPLWVFIDVQFFFIEAACHVIIRMECFLL